jgi:hypothetical protein
VRLTKAQIAQISKWAKSGRLIVQPVMPAESIPEWAKYEFRLARAVVDVMRDGVKWQDAKAAKQAREGVSREALSSILAKIEGKTTEKSTSYRKGARKAWATRKKQVAARAQGEAAEMGKEAA